MQIIDYKDYRQYLKDVFEERIRRNGHYTLRAFARDLSIPVQVISAVFLNKKGISTDVALKLSKCLGFNEDESFYFCDLVESAHARSTAARKVAAIRLSKYRKESKYTILSDDNFRAISDWYHYAILELTLVDGFRSEVRWIAQRLRISEHEVSQALGRLRRLNLISVNNGHIKKNMDSVTTTHDVPSAAIRNFNRQILERAADALERQSVDERDMSTMTLALDPAKMDEAKSIIKRFRRELTAVLETGPSKEVYCLAIQLFRLSEPGEKKS